MNLLAIDQGTTGTTTVVVNNAGESVYKSYQEFTQIYPQPGWVEHDPDEIWQTVVATVKDALQKTSGGLAGIGITNQRETTLLWRRSTGQPLHNAIVWQCRRTAEYCESLRASAPMIREKTGLPLDAYFSATKIRWLLDHLAIDDLHDLCFGTIDSWLIWKLTGGQVHATDMTNASRTMLFNIDTKSWDPELCALFGIPMHILPEVKTSIADYGIVSTLDAL